MQDGILLVGGHLQNANISDAQKHPIVLHAYHRLTRLIFENVHKKMPYCGPQVLFT